MEPFFLQKLDENNNLIWVKTFEGKGEINLGYGDTVLQFVNNSPYTDAFIQSLAPNGDIIWTKTFGNASTDNVMDIEVSPNGKLYSTGSFIDTVEFSTGDPNSIEVSQGRDIYIMCWNSSDGSFNWVEKF